MSQMVLKSGFSGNVAKVDINGRVFVDAKTFFAEEVAARQGEAYILHAVCHLDAAVSGGLLAFTSEDPTFAYAITRIYIDAHSLSNDIIVHQVKNPVISGGTDISDTGMVNKNFGSGKTMAAVLKVSDALADLTYTGGTDYHSFIMQSKQSQARDMRGTNFIGNGNTFLMGWETLDGGNAVDGEKISLSINLYRIPVEEAS